MGDKVFTVEGKMKKSKPELLYNMYKLFCTLCGRSLSSRVKIPTPYVRSTLALFLMPEHQSDSGQTL